MNKISFYLIFLLLLTQNIFRAGAESVPDTVSAEQEKPIQQAAEEEVTSRDTSEKLVYIVEVKEEIAPPVFRMMQKSFEDAREKQADLIVLHMNTYGGMVQVADSMRTKVLSSAIPVVVFIDNNAASAGALISIACDSIYMRKSGNIGAATVVNQGQEEMPDKYQSYMRSTMRSTADSKGRDPRIAEAMVDSDVHIPGIIDSGKVLTFTATEAAEHGFCDGIYEDMPSVIASYGFENYRKQKYEATGIDKIIGFLINPVVNGLLIMLIIGGIYFELQTPGIGFAIIVAALSAVLYFAPLYLEGLAGHWEILMFIAGLILIAVEVFALPGFGVAGVSGLVLMVAGLSLSLVDNVGFDFSFVRADHIVKAFFTVIFATFLALLGSYLLSVKMFAGKSKIFSNLALQDELTAETGYTSADATMSSMLNQKGEAYTVLRPSGKVIIGEDIYDATAETGYIEKGETVEVVAYHNTQLIVSRIFEDE
ncbi:MAG: NfeD family protein [Bacteroidales bacterium]